LLRLSIETKHVMGDLRELMQFDINAYGRASALIRELYDNQGSVVGQDLIDQLNIQGRNLSAPSVMGTMVGNCLRLEHEKLQRDLWRLKLWRIDDRGHQHLEPYRIIYGFFQATQTRKVPEIRIFAVPCRTKAREDSYDYQHDHPISVRVRGDYDAYR
jgi:hypothetical protein